MKDEFRRHSSEAEQDAAPVQVQEKKIVDSHFSCVNLHSPVCLLRTRRVILQQ
jgi:hypothetical protein